MAQLAGDEVSHQVATQALLLAATANTMVKGGLTLVLGAPSLRRYTLPVLAVLTLTSLGLAAWM
jgi:uncharacterized membrane protein (DUF4010 family)